MKITDIILEELSKKNLTGSEITNILKNKNIMSNIRPRLRELEINNRIVKINNERPYRYKTLPFKKISQKDLIKTLYNIMTKKMIVKDGEKLTNEEKEIILLLDKRIK